MSTTSGTFEDLSCDAALQALIVLLCKPPSDASAIGAAQAVQRFADSGTRQREALLDCELLLPPLCELVRSAAAAQAVRVSAALALWSLAASERGRDAIREAGGLAPLVALLCSPADSCSGHEAAANALKRLAISEANEDAIREAGGVPALVSLIQNADESAATHEAACLALQNLASDTNEANQAAIREAGGLQALVDLATDPRTPACTCEAAAVALDNLRTDPVSSALLEALETASTKVKDEPSLPQNWDPAVIFTNRLLCEGDLSLLQQSINCALHSRPEPCGLVQILDISCSEHPCCGHRGLFASIAIAAGTRVLQYVGVAKQRAVGDSSDYLYALQKLDGSLEMDIDAARAGNESRFINDYRGVQGRAKNLQFVQSRSSLGEVEVWVEATCAISPGEELLVSYGKKYFP